MDQLNADKKDENISALSRKKSAMRVTGYIFLATVCLLILSITIIYWIGLRALKSNHVLAAQREIIEKLERFESSVKDMETSQRGYILTADQEYFAAYKESLDKMQKQLERVRQMSEKGDIEPQQERQISRLTKEKVDEMDETVNLIRNNQRNEALVIVRSNKGKQIMDQLRLEVAAVKDHEIEGVHVGNVGTERGTNERNLTFFFSALINLAFLAWAYLKLTREMRRRALVEEALRKSHLELELRVQKRTADLEAANRELEAFGYSVSHDLRAPLRHVSSYINLLEKNAGANLDTTSRKYVHIITQASQRMGQLIDDLLSLSRIGRASFSESIISMNQLVDGTIKELAPDTQGREIEWEITSLPKVRGDLTLLRSAMVNLLSNAVKYTRAAKPARIQIGSKEGNDEVVCFVKDNGAGFDMQFVDKLFGVFQRLHDQSEFEGTGIGLASVRRIIQRHGGKTWAEGVVGQGAVFYFSIPKDRIA
jgi:signal transduction histidine kinase